MKAKIIIAGDLIPTEENISLFEDGDAGSLFGKEVCKIFAEADFSIVNLEGALTDSDVFQIKDGPVIKASKTSIAGIKNLGISAVTLANNHVTDYLQKGIDDTIDVLEKAGIKHVGIVKRGKEEQIANKFLSINLKGHKICIYNVSETFFNRPSKEMDGANVYDEWIVLNEIKELKQQHDFLFVIYHGGAEYFPYPTPQTLTRFHRMADCGADFVTAQHSHCIGCEELYKGSYLLYGQGNFLFARQKNPMTKQGLITEIKINEYDFSIKNHLVNTIDSKLQYDKEQDLTAFKERSKHIDDEKYIIELFTTLKRNEIMRKYLLAAKGEFPFRKFLRKCFKKAYNHPEKYYEQEQIVKNLILLQGDRRREDMFYVWKNLFDNYRQNGN